METVLATFGGVLLLLSLSTGVWIKLKGYLDSQGSLKGDRIGACLIGISLIAMAVVLSIDAPLVSLLSTFGVAVALTLLYALSLLLARSE